MNGRTVVITALTATFLGSLYFVYAPSTFPNMTKSASKAPSGVPGLEFKLSQISKNPPSLLVTLKNSSPGLSFTLLKWGTPLDPQASNLGVFQLIDAETGEAVKSDILKIGRKMPPSRDDLQEISPGTEHAIEVVLDKPWMPRKKPAKYKVTAQGKLHGVWEKPASELATEELESYADSPFSDRAFSTEEVLLAVE
ncbi:hypothetical protein K491DRAFT_669997 [Lophiostoma macrostomum CBS 122681]|uniref:Uncharacterized protein n=1 Tax=Lophiostoma macrostomum CBS 122681 TaxID=1314788 RepID=A0A6A6SRJ9_9PLEO|nr:hypothetical protein K491DRAFT_669997 [Lophiostoma macrostomum CBS 122681]